MTHQPSFSQAEFAAGCLVTTRLLLAVCAGSWFAAIAEYTRPLDFKSGLPQMPGRILELKVKN